MKPSLISRLDSLSDRYEELTAMLGDAQVINEQKLFRDYSREYAEVEPVVQAYQRWSKLQGDLEEARALLKDSDPEVREMAGEEVSECREQIVRLEEELQV